MAGLVLAAAFISCNNSNDEEWEQYLKDLEEYNKKAYEQFQTDSTLIVEYLEENDSIALFHEDLNIFYNILNEGGEVHPNEYSYVNVHYKGMLLDGTIFDATEDEPIQFNLSELLSGWQLGLPLIGEGGKIVLYLPSYYAYGESEIGNIPANSVLIFEIELVGVWLY